MAKGYWINVFHSIKDQAKVDAYRKLAGPAISAAGGRFLARGNPSKVYEGGVNQRIVIIEFDSVDRAIAAHDSAEYQSALKALGNGVDREIRIVEGV